MAARTNSNSVDDMNEELIEAASRGEEEDVRRLLKEGADVNAVDNSGTTPTKAEIKEAKRLEKEAEKAAKEAKRKEKKGKKGGGGDEAAAASDHKRPKMNPVASMAAANERAMAAIVAAAPADNGNVTRTEFNLLMQAMKQMQQQMAQITVLVEEPLTFEEQEELAEAINNISPDMLAGIVQILRESATVADDEDEVDLYIDQLDTTTQRKLQRYVMKNVKKKKKSKAKKAKAALRFDG